MENEFGEGSIIQVDGKEGVVLSVVKDNNGEYAVVSFQEDQKKVNVDVYEIVRKEVDVYFKDIKNEELKADLLASFAIEVYE